MEAHIFCAFLFSRVAQRESSQQQLSFDADWVNIGLLIVERWSEVGTIRLCPSCLGVTSALYFST